MVLGGLHVKVSMEALEHGADGFVVAAKIVEDAFAAPPQQVRCRRLTWQLDYDVINIPAVTIGAMRCHVTLLVYVWDFDATCVAHGNRRDEAPSGELSRDEVFAGDAGPVGGWVHGGG